MPDTRRSFVFDTNFNYSIKQTQNSKRQNQQRIGTPPELVKNYEIIFFKDNEVVFKKEIKDNHQRLNKHKFTEIECDKVSVTITETNGCEDVRIYEIRIY